LSDTEIENLYLKNNPEPESGFQNFLISNNANATRACDYLEVTGDIFSLDKTWAIGHCVCKYLTMSQGIALKFKNKFNNIKQLINQNKNTNEIAYLSTDDQWLLYLITKDNNYNDKHKYSNIFKTLENTKQFCIKNKIKKLAFPKICSGLDNKKWDITSNMIKFIFKNTFIKIKILSLPEGKGNNLLQNYENIYPINDNKNYSSAIETNKIKDIYLNNSNISINNESKNINKHVCAYVDKHYNTRVLSIIVEYEGIEKYAIIDTGSNISCIDMSLINDMELVKKE
ncbi:Uncharacterized protein FWK35_00038490, partial [Aphis craccivora]